MTSEYAIFILVVIFCVVIWEVVARNFMREEPLWLKTGVGFILTTINSQLAFYLIEQGTEKPFPLKETGPVVVLGFFVYYVFANMNKNPAQQGLAVEEDGEPDRDKPKKKAGKGKNRRRKGKNR